MDCTVLWLGLYRLLIQSAWQSLTENLPSRRAVVGFLVGYTVMDLNGIINAVWLQMGLESLFDFGLQSLLTAFRWGLLRPLLYWLLWWSLF